MSFVFFVCGCFFDLSLENIKFAITLKIILIGDRDQERNNSMGHVLLNDEVDKLSKSLACWFEAYT